MIRARPATTGDRQSLESFCCTGQLDGYEHQAETAVRQAPQWSAQRSDRRVMVVVDDENEGQEEIVAVATYRPLIPGHESFGWTVEVIAVALTRQDAGIGQALFQRVLDELAAEYPGGLVQWFVHEENQTSLHISGKVGQVQFVLDDPPPGHQTWAARLPS